MAEGKHEIVKANLGPMSKSHESETTGTIYISKYSGRVKCYIFADVAVNWVSVGSKFKMADL